MKKVLLNAFSFLILTQMCEAQINVQWETRFTGTGNNPDNISDMYVDASGNIYVTGSSYSTVSGYDIITRKYDNNGGVTWTATFNGDGNGTDVANALAIDASGNVFVTGYSYRGGVNYDITTIKYLSATGAQSWQAYSGNGTSAFDEGKDITINAAGNVVVTGGVQNAAGSNTDFRTILYPNGSSTPTWTQDYSNSANLDIAIAVVTDASNNVYVTGHSFVTGQDLNIRTIKYNSAGTQQYNTATNFSVINSIDSPSKIVVNSAGEVFVAGRVFNGSTTDDDIVVMKYNAAGTVINSAIINGTSDLVDKANRIYLDASNNLYLAGKVKNLGTSEDFYLAKFNSSLALLWDDSYNGPSNNYDEATDITIDGSGNVYVCGFSFGASSNNDFVTVKYDGTAGTRTWITKFNGTANNNDQAKRINVDAAGNVYVSGDSKGAGTGTDYSTIKYCQLTTDAGPDVSICINDDVQFNATGGTSFSWQAAASLSCTNCNNPLATPTGTTTYILSSTSGTGCVDYDTVQVIVNPLPGPVITPSGPTDFCAGGSVILYATGFSSYVWTPSGTADSILVNSSGTYTVTVTDSMGCQNSTSQVVNVFALPTIDAGTATPYCDGDSTQLLASGGESYVWTPNSDLNDNLVSNPYVSTSTSSWYYVVGTDANGCIGDDSVFVTVNPLPAAPLVTYVQATQLAVSGTPNGNQWYFNGNPIPGETNQSYTITVPGQYWTNITDTNGCTSGNSDTIIFTVSTNDLSVLNGINIFPNPNSGLFNVNFEKSNFENAVVEIYDITGKIILTEMITRAANVFDIREYNNGLYLMRIAVSGEQLPYRIVKQ